VAPSNIAVHSGKEGIKSGKKRHNLCLEGGMTMTEHDDGKAGGFDVVCVTTVVHNNNS
jgi:hypothetical protein